MSENTFAEIEIKRSAGISSIVSRNMSTATNTTINLINNTFANIGGLTPDSNGTIRLAVTQLNLNNQNFQLSRTTKAKFDLFIRIAYDLPYIMPLYSCPVGNNVRVSSCTIEQLNTLQWQNSLTEYNIQATPPETGTYYLSDNEFYQYFVYHIEIYYPNDELTTITQINFQSQTQITTMWQNSQYFSSQVYVTLGFSPLQSYTESLTLEEEQAQKELESTSNIENQTPENTGGSSSENQQTTSIIGTISSFVSAFSNITPSQNCEMDLPFPDFVGGDQRVNICQGKDKAPAIITIASSLLLIVTFVPIAFIVLSMIYREIRSFTNG